MFKKVNYDIKFVASVDFNQMPKLSKLSDFEKGSIRKNAI